MMVSVMLFQVSWHKKRAAISLVISGLWAFACWLLPLRSTAFVPLKAHIWICCLCRELTVQFFATITKRVFRGSIASRQKSFNIKNMSYLAICISYQICFQVTFVFRADHKGGKNVSVGPQFFHNWEEDLESAVCSFV